jgi:small Trp-rich protein
MAMYLLMIGILGIALKYLQIGPVAAWSWWVVLSPFGLAVAWWWWADKSGYTERTAIAKMEKRKQERIDKQRDAMGMLKKRK